jgi:hypothetical protein
MIRRNFFDADYDSRLGYPDQQNMSPFIIVLKVHLKQFNPSRGQTYQQVADFDGDVYKFQGWTDNEWKTFTSEFKREAEKYLNWPRMKLWLLPTAHGKGRMGQIQILYFVHRRPIKKDFVPFVQCGLKVEFVTKEEQSHVWWDVVRLKDGQKDFRSYDSNHKSARDRGMMTNQDIELWSTASSEGIPQSTIAHELGHVLNLDHININGRGCTTGGEDICYGKRGTRMRRNWMGGGNEVSGANSSPWVDRIPVHARNLDWHVTTHKPNAS